MILDFVFSSGCILFAFRESALRSKSNSLSEQLTMNTVSIHICLLIPSLLGRFHEPRIGLVRRKKTLSAVDLGQKSVVT